MASLDEKDEETRSWVAELAATMMSETPYHQIEIRRTIKEIVSPEVLGEILSIDSLLDSLIGHDLVAKAREKIDYRHWHCCKTCGGRWLHNDRKCEFLDQVDGRGCCPKCVAES